MIHKKKPSFKKAEVLKYIIDWQINRNVVSFPLPEAKHLISTSCTKEPTQEECRHGGCGCLGGLVRSGLAFKVRIFL